MPGVALPPGLPPVPDLLRRGVLSCLDLSVSTVTDPTLHVQDLERTHGLIARNDEQVDARLPVYDEV